MNPGQKPDEYVICKLENGRWRTMVGPFDTMEQAQKVIYDLRNYYWKPGEEAVIFRLSYHPEILVKAYVTLESKKL